MDLREAWIGEKRSLFVGAIRRGDIAATRVRREVEHVSVSAGSQHNCVAHMPLDFSGDETSSDDTLGVAID